MPEPPANRNIRLRDKLNEELTKLLLEFHEVQGFCVAVAYQPPLNNAIGFVDGVWVTGHGTGAKPADVIFNSAAAVLRLQEEIFRQAALRLGAMMALKEKYEPKETTPETPAGAIIERQTAPGQTGPN